MRNFDKAMMSPAVGEKGAGKSTGKPLHYKGSHFHRIIKGFMAQVCSFYFRTYVLCMAISAGCMHAFFLFYSY